ncbi:uracil-DNA glycosylase [Candidatus Kaiserbacteria bacterium RIFCSPLOWO2_02_FULL_45_11b]|uniref:Uracil-DNA glycosylase n=1 Tax=Candidatus Kaiserbacteria bacterium RIFCSPLOWO2_12_FULL_45_26 TaxID=1798525 RepID=A0A1F6FHA3_9BACT|nr:MAG: uracil-DNA glycosylase [Candidatus Kaiserbacteria bacterium RIFCSPHIGHO2_12_45_16]OGG70877.1 MAG: uracil-DNA glycosylase [Candidatus Kaiserbacteria bacterium RIFCSPLOWO2_01_FULL_45_25]OGG83745.1 MAG: uracil-DNA glycosylase [Candidatus Kaiserbacteria bacterium RIFCSPLOWO2_02_FULL_45_11b]OGG85240.1 MAG: uracil-DNA glycosylase [Candidatus Kaiserbacteria bacterium RIFCSPLOWO2_12_FULL_45_26]
MENLIPNDWHTLLTSEVIKSYFKALEGEISAQYLTKTIYPDRQSIFKAFYLCPFADVRVVILGQDPYHGVGQAHGLSFSVPGEQKLPPSLRNIYKELESDLGQTANTSGDLTHWAKQGVLLLNSTLTVEAGLPASHQGLGWETFTDAVIAKISKAKEHVVFLLWGKFAQEKKSLINETKHLVLTAPHPSPFSAYTGFFGCKHFSQTNEYLKQHGSKPINW